MRPYVVVLVLALVPATDAFAGPEIFSLDPESGPAGVVITLKGKGPETTGHVAFAVGRTVKPARFKVVSDRELQVVAPEFYRPRAAATVAVFTRSGATVAMPATVRAIDAPVRGANLGEPGAGFYHVLDGGIVTHAGSVALIEAGGVVERGSMAGMHFVRRGGTLLDYDNPNGIIVHEPGAIFGPNLFRSNRRLTVIREPSVSVSPGVGPFLYEQVPGPDPGTAPATPPEIRSLEPRVAAAGEIITVHGRGFARTTRVDFFEPHSSLRPAGFRVVSDNVLRVEVPDQVLRFGPQLLIIQSPEGLTVTVPDTATVDAAVLRRLSNPVGVYWVSRGDIIEARGRAWGVFVEDGGLLTKAPGGKVLFVQADGRVGAGGGAPAAVFYEPGAILPENLKAGKNATAHEVTYVLPSFLPSPFVVDPGPIFRR